MKTRSIIFTSPCVTELLDAEVGEPAADEVIVRLKYSTVSAGTERANLVGDKNVSPAMPEGAIKFPRASGYSSSGTVVCVGERVTTLKPGDTVSCSWSKHTRYCKLKETKVHKIDDSIDMMSAAMVHIATFPLAAIRKCRIEVGESVLVMGFGVLGMVALELLKAVGAAPIIVADPSSEKRELALKSGADYVFDPFKEDFAKNVREVTDGGAAAALEITGYGSGLDLALDCMARFGRIALLGCTRSSDFSIDYYRKVHGPGITLIGAHTMARPKQESHGGWWTENDDITAVLRLIKYRGLDIGSLVTEIYSPTEAPEVYSRLAAGGPFPIVQFDWDLLED